jgi:hypothetical protein
VGRHQYYDFFVATHLSSRHELLPANFLTVA